MKTKLNVGDIVKYGSFFAKVERTFKGEKTWWATIMLLGGQRVQVAQGSLEIIFPA